MPQHDIDSEQKKWDDYYASLESVEEDPRIRDFGDELARHIQQLLPRGGRVLEAGCGSGWQARALARLGLFDITLMDFSREALRHARANFAREGLSATFLCEDARCPGRPEYDLVYNVGVLEHYRLEEQVEFIKALATRSRRYVLVVVPNALCYWYWGYRIGATARGDWPWGKEIPCIDLMEPLASAGLRPLGQAFFADRWTEIFIEQSLAGHEKLKEEMLALHRSPALPREHRCYLVGFLGGLHPKNNSPPAGWHRRLYRETPDTAELRAALIDALALNVRSASHAAELEKHLTELADRQQKSIADLQRQLRDYESALGMARQAVEHAHEQLTFMRRQADSIQSRMDAAGHRMRQLLVTFSGAGGDLPTIEEVVQAFETAIQTHIQEIHEARSALLRSREEFERLQKRFADTSALLAERDRAVEELQRQLAGSREESECLQKRFADTSALLAERDRAVEELQRQLADSREESGRMEAALSEMSAACQTQAQRADRLEEQLQLKSREMKTLLDRYLQTQRQLSKLEEAHYRAVAERSELLHALRKGLSDRALDCPSLSRANEQSPLREIANGLVEDISAVVTAARDAQREASQREHAAMAAMVEMQSSSGWVLLQGLHKVRLILAPTGSLRHRAMRAILWSIIGILRSCKRGASRSLTGLKTLGLPLKMSWYAFAFDRFKRARCRQVGSSFARLQVPCQAGMVSVVLPVYNGEDYIRESIESVLAQTYPDFELIIVDDGSTDRTPVILEEYAARDRRIRVHHQENQKLPRALSNGFRLARGEFLTWTSADNRLKPDFLEKMVACLRRHPSWDMIYANQDIIGDDGQPLHGSDWFALYQRPTGSEHIHLPRDPSELNTWANNYVGAAFMYRSRVWQLLGDYSPYRFGLEDYDYWMRVNIFFNLRHSDFDEPIYEYRFHATSLTSRDRELKITQRRQRMMVFDTLRRDFALTPLAWVFDVRAGSSIGRKKARSLRERVHSQGHVCIDEPAEVSKDWPTFWTPLVYLRVTEDAGGSPPEDLPACALKVLMHVGGDDLPAVVDPRWDLCISWSRQKAPPLLPRPRQGWLAADEVHTIFAAIDTRARNDELERIEAQIENPPAPSCKLSVVICTYRRGERLMPALVSVTRQTMPRDDYEILVVNNAPADGEPRRICEQVRREHMPLHPDRLRYVTCALPGLSHARNAGIAEARGEVICFLDDDAIARPDWLEQTWRIYAEHPEVGVVGGKILLKEPDPRPAWLEPDWWSYWSHYAPGYEQCTDVEHWWEFPWGANWTARRRTLLEIGGFRTAYGRCRHDYGGGEELIASALARSLGWRVAIAPASEVLHDVDPARFTLRHVRATIKAGTHVIYQGQRDLYLPMEPVPPKCWRRIAEYGRAIAAKPLDRWPRQFRRLAYIRAEFSLLVRYWADQWRRRRTPVSLRR